VSDPQVGPHVTMATLALQLTALTAKVDKHLDVIDQTIVSVVDAKQAGTRRALVGAYVLALGACVLIAAVGWLGYRETRIVDTLETQQIEIATQDAETQRIRRDVLCPFIIEALAYDPAGLAPDQRAQFERLSGVYRNAYFTLRCG
jgi:hypothetical protein